MKTNCKKIFILILSVIFVFSCEVKTSDNIKGGISEENLKKINEVYEFMHDYNIINEKLINTLENMADKILANKTEIEELKKRIEELELK